MSISEKAAPLFWTIVGRSGDSDYHHRPLQRGHAQNADHAKLWINDLISRENWRVSLVMRAFNSQNLKSQVRRCKQGASRKRLCQPADDVLMPTMMFIMNLRPYSSCGACTSIRLWLWISGRWWHLCSIHADISLFLLLSLCIHDPRRGSASRIKEVIETTQW